MKESSSSSSDSNVSRSPSKLDLVIPTVITTSTALALFYIYRNYFKRIPTSAHIPHSFFKKRRLYGRVVSVGDADNFRFYHTPGGRWLGWGWLRNVKEGRKELKGQTIHVRIAGVDAPELSHFGKPAQPYSSESLAFLTNLLINRPVRISPLRRDQYERIVSTARVRHRGIRGLLNLKQDVGLAMLKTGSAQVYEATTGAEFGKEGMENVYRQAEQKARKQKKGMWGAKGVFESPGEYKKRIKAEGTVTTEASTKRINFTSRRPS